MIFNLGHKSKTPKCMIVGLGNPGPKYDKTRHNAGFLFIDYLSEKYGISINKIKFHALIGQVEINNINCLLVKPQTLMNNSGVSVGEAASFYKIKPENIIVVYDDISLQPGVLRIRRKGSDGGHNGIKSIISHIDSEDFPRIKIGIGAKPHPDYDLAKWVLSKFSNDDLKLLENANQRACDAIPYMVSGDIDNAMNKYNG